MARDHHCLASHGKIRKSVLSQFVADEQDPGAVEKILSQGPDLLTRTRVFRTSPYRKSRSSTYRRRLSSLQTNRLIIVRPSLLGMTFEDFLWTHVNDVHMSEQIPRRNDHGNDRPQKSRGRLPPEKAGTPRLRTRSGNRTENVARPSRPCHRGNARQVRRNDISDSPPMPQANLPAQPATQANDPHASLLSLKQMMDSGLISQAEYDAKKNELLSRL